MQHFSSYRFRLVEGEREEELLARAVRVLDDQ